VNVLTHQLTPTQFTQRFRQFIRRAVMSLQSLRCRAVIGAAMVYFLALGGGANAESGDNFDLVFRCYKQSAAMLGAQSCQNPQALAEATYGRCIEVENRLRRYWDDMGFPGNESVSTLRKEYRARIIDRIVRSQIDRGCP
jgi:hypothetical protein